MTTKSTTVEPTRVASEGTLVLVCVLAWALPGAGHLWLGRRQKAVVFMAALLVMFGIGLLLAGRVFSMDLREPLVALAAVADMGLGVPWLLTKMMGAGEGTVTASTYEYGNCFL